MHGKEGHILAVYNGHAVKITAFQAETCDFNSFYSQVDCPVSKSCWLQLFPENELIYVFINKETKIFGKREARLTPYEIQRWASQQGDRA